MKIWFSGSAPIAASLSQIYNALAQFGKHHTDTVSKMPGMLSVELQEETSDSITIKTNEGIMKRYNMVLEQGDSFVRMTFIEHYHAGKVTDTTCHYDLTFTQEADQVVLTATLSDLNASGFMGWLYKTFGSKNIGKAVLQTYASYFEQ